MNIMGEKGSAVVVVLLCCAVLGIPTPGGKQGRAILNQKENTQKKNAQNVVNEIVNGITELVKKETHLNKNPTNLTISHHDDSTKNKVISHGILVPMATVSVDDVANVTIPGNIVGLRSKNEYFIPDGNEAGSGYITEVEENNESDGVNKEMGDATTVDPAIKSLLTKDSHQETLGTTSKTVTKKSSSLKTSIKTETPMFDIVTTINDLTSLSSATASQKSLTTTSSATITTTSSITIISTASATTTSTLFSPENLALSDSEENEEEPRELCDAIPNNSILRNGLGSTGFTWPEGKIPYKIGDGFSENQTNTIQSAIDYYNNEFEGCLQWVVRGSESNYVTFENTGTCSSRIGVAFYPFPVSQSIHLGRCSHLEGHIKHEMMHTIGFYHEHSRSDRDMYIKVG